MINSINLKNNFIYDTRLDNLKLLNRLNENLLINFSSLKNISNRNSRVIVSNMKDLESALQNNIKNIYINFDLGDRREGFRINQKHNVINKIKSHNIKNKKLGLMSNTGCFRLKKPTIEYFSNLHRLGLYFTEKNIPLSFISIGGSNCLPFLEKENDILQRPELRIGEAIFIGTIPHSTFDLGLKNNIVFLKAKIIKRNKSLLIDKGYNQIDQSCILSKSGYKILYQSSEVSCISLNKNLLGQIDPDNYILIPLSYKGLSRLSHLKDVKYYFAK